MIFSAAGELTRESKQRDLAKRANKEESKHRYQKKSKHRDVAGEQTERSTRISSKVAMNGCHFQASQCRLVAESLEMVGDREHI